MGMLGNLQFLSCQLPLAEACVDAPVICYDEIDETACCADDACTETKGFAGIRISSSSNFCNCIDCFVSFPQLQDGTILSYPTPRLISNNSAIHTDKSLLTSSAVRFYKQQSRAPDITAQSLGIQSTVLLI
jgi:hypothetical protein